MLYITKNAYQILHTTYYILPTRHYILPTTYYVLPTRYCILSTTYYALCTTYYIVILHSMITVFTILGTRHYLLDNQNLHDTYNELILLCADIKSHAFFRILVLHSDILLLENVSNLTAADIQNYKQVLSAQVHTFHHYIHMMVKAAGSNDVHL